MTDTVDFNPEKKNDLQSFEARYFNVTNDVAFKKVFLHPALTLSFLNSTLRLTGERQIKTVDFLPTEQLPMTSESKKSILDVMCTDHRGFRYIIEVQNKYMSNYIQRAQYYISHLYAGQLEQAGNYLQLKPVTLLSLLNHSIFPKQVKYLSYHQNIEQETHTSYLNDMSYAFVELPKFTKTLQELTTNEDHWIYMMKHSSQMREPSQGAPQEVKQAYDILERHTWTRKERLAYEQAKIGLMDDLDAIQTARDEGEQIGLEKGKEQGSEQRAIEIAKQLFATGMDLEQIQQITNLSFNKLHQLQHQSKS